MSRKGRRSSNGGSPQRNLRLTLAGWWVASRMVRHPVVAMQERELDVRWMITPAGIAALGRKTA